MPWTWDKFSLNWRKLQIYQRQLHKYLRHFNKLHLNLRKISPVSKTNPKVKLHLYLRQILPELKKIAHISKTIESISRHFLTNSTCTKGKFYLYQRQTNFLGFANQFHDLSSNHSYFWNNILNIKLTSDCIFIYI